MHKSQTKSMTHRFWSYQLGMTLLELLVAIAIFSIVATAGYAALDQGLSIQDKLQDKRILWRRLETVFMLLQSDLDQAIERSPRIPGLINSFPFEGNRNARSTSGGEFLKFTRGGNNSFRDGPVSPYLRIAYQLRDGNLYRVIWPRLDVPFGEQGEEAKILEGVKSIRMRYLLSKGRWVHSWTTHVRAEERASLPKAVELRLEFENHGPYVWLFHIGRPG